MKTWKGYQKGVNLGGWFSQCDYSEDRFNNFITEDDFKELTSWGLDHLRLPVDYNLVQKTDSIRKKVLHGSNVHWNSDINMVSI